MNKKGNAVFVGIFIIVVLILFSLISMMAYQGMDYAYDSMYSDLSSNESKEALQETHSRYPATFDAIVLVIFVGVWLGGIGAAMVKEEHPILFGMMLFIIIFVLIAGAVLANSYEELLESDDFSTLPSTFPISYFIITHMLELGIGMILSVLLIVMAKNRS